MSLRRTLVVAGLGLCAAVSMGQETSRIIGRLEVPRSGDRVAFVLVEKEGRRRQVIIPANVLASNNGVRSIEGRWVIAKAIPGRIPTVQSLSIVPQEIRDMTSDPLILDRLPSQQDLQPVEPAYRGPVRSAYDAMRARILSRASLPSVLTRKTIQLSGKSSVVRIYTKEQLATHYYLVSPASAFGNQASGVTIEEVNEDQIVSGPDRDGVIVMQEAAPVPNPFGGRAWYKGQSLKGPGGLKIEVTNDGPSPEISVNPAGLSIAPVLNTNDSGEGSLRNAIQFVNDNPPTQVQFAISGPTGFDGVAYQIVLAGELPAFTQPGIKLRGSQQTAATGDTNPNGPEVFIKGLGLEDTSSGLIFNGANALVEGIGVTNFGGSGILLRGSNSSVDGCWAGVKHDGTTAEVNWNGILIEATATDCVIGTRPGAGNLVSGNVSSGIRIKGANAFVFGNTVGLSFDRKIAVPNQLGIYAGTGSIIGAVGAGNAVGGNASAGIYVRLVSSVVIRGNVIGYTGTPVINPQDGIHISASDTVIGGKLPGEGNIICGNSAGISIIGRANYQVLGNRIGVNADDTAVPNQVGIELAAGAGAMIGDGTASGRNIISGNVEAGIRGDFFGMRILGNRIGTDNSGLLARPNGAGIVSKGRDITIGGASSTLGNTISGNKGAGISLSECLVTLQGNTIGTSPDGNTAVPNATGIALTKCDQANVGLAAAAAGNVISGNTGVGLLLDGVTHSWVRNNLVGISRSGVALKNGADGIRLLNVSTGVTIGGTGTYDRNVISGNGNAGINLIGNPTTGLAQSSNTIIGNLVGLNRTGGTAVPNKLGISIRGGSHHNKIGDLAAGAGNIVSGNLTYGIFVGDAKCDFNSIQGNFVGTNAAGTNAVPNGGNGITIATGAKSNAIGTTLANLIFGNQGYGLRLAGAGTSLNLVKYNNFRNNVQNQIRIDSGASSNTIFKNVLTTNIGPAAISVADPASIGNNLRSNTFDIGDRMLVDLVGNDFLFGVTPNDLGDVDSGPNNLQNNATIDTAKLTGATATYKGTLTGPASSTFTVDVFLYDVANSAFHGGKLRLLQSFSVTTSAAGVATFTRSIAVTGSPLGLCTQVTSASGDTSEISANTAFTP